MNNETGQSSFNNNIFITCTLPKKMYPGGSAKLLNKDANFKLKIVNIPTCRIFQVDLFAKTRIALFLDWCQS